MILFIKVRLWIVLPGVVGRRERDVSVWRDVQHTVFRLDPDAKQLDVLRRVGSHTRVILKQSKHLRGGTEEFSCMCAELHKRRCCSRHISTNSTAADKHLLLVLFSQVSIRANAPHTTALMDILWPSAARSVNHYFESEETESDESGWTGQMV